MLYNAWKKKILKIVSKTILEPKNGLENDVCEAPMFCFSFFDKNELFFHQIIVDFSYVCM